jgi:hypothetical protein
VSIMSYCDDITLISSSIHDMNRLLRICGDYAKDWKLEFSINKCNWTCFGKEVYNDAKFTFQNQELCYSENVIHLGLPIGSREFVNNYLKEKFYFIFIVLLFFFFFFNIHVMVLFFNK